MPNFVEIFDLLKQEPEVAGAVAAIGGTIAALLALFVSFVSLVVSALALRHQRQHNTLTVKPIPEVTVADFEDSLRVKLRNHGSGPLIIRSLRAERSGTIYTSLIEAMPDLPGREWTNFCGVIDGRSLLPGKEIVLIELTADENELLFNIPRDLARKALALSRVTVQYTDVYNTEFQNHAKSLEWFGRNL